MTSLGGPLRRDLNKSSNFPLTVIHHTPLTMHESGVNTDTELNTPPKRKRYYAVPPIRDSTGRRAHATGRAGSKRRTRHDNMMYLLEQADNIEDLDLTPVVEPKRSVFTAMLESEEQLLKWLDFTARADDFQQAFLRQTTVESAHPYTKAKLQSAEDPHLCYLRIDRRLRASLRKRRVPPTPLLLVERVLMDSLTEFPTAPHAVKMENSFLRLLVHATCQYHGLVARSEDLASGRHTIIRSTSAGYISPKVGLFDYLSLNSM